MAEILAFTPRKPSAPTMTASLEPNSEFGKLMGKMVKKPRTGKQFLELCRDTLYGDTYSNVLCAIMDELIYKDSPPHIQQIVDVYMEYKV